jgi:hypothetical protein
MEVFPPMLNPTEQLMIGDHGPLLLRGEFRAITTLNSLIPGLVPVPLGWGTIQTSEPTET